MLNTTLCYVTRGSQVLMLHRVKKKADINKDKWIGIGGKFEGEESPDECLLREAKEETGLTLTSWQCRGVVTFLNDTCEGEYMYLFTADGFTGTLKECDEGDLEWIPKSRLLELYQSEKDAKEAGQRRSMVGSGDRSERIRTYNFPQGRVTDHRINLTLYRLESFLDGDMDEVIDALTIAQRAAQLSGEQA